MCTVLGQTRQTFGKAFDLSSQYQLNAIRATPLEQQILTQSSPLPQLMNTPTAASWVRRSDRGSPPVESPCLVGAKVYAADPHTATWKGQWFPGVITASKQRDRTYSVAFEDGDKRDSLAECHVSTSDQRPPPLPPASSRKRPRAQRSCVEVVQSDEERRQRRQLASRSKAAEMLRQGSGMLAREVLDAAAAGSLHTDPIRYSR